MLLPEINSIIKQFAKDSSITYGEAMDKIETYQKSFKKFKARLPLVAKLEINVAKYSQDPVPHDNRVFTSPKEILNYALTLKEECNSFRVTFVNGANYACGPGWSQYTNNYNEVVVTFLRNYC